jgi:hypothetical protein
VACAFDTRIVGRFLLWLKTTGSHYGTLDRMPRQERDQRTNGTDLALVVLVDRLPLM